MASRTNIQWVISVGIAAVVFLFLILVSPKMIESAENQRKGFIRTSRCGGLGAEEPFRDCCEKLPLGQSAHASYDLDGQCFEAKPDDHPESEAIAAVFVCIADIVEARMHESGDCVAHDICDLVELRYKGAPPSIRGHQLSSDCSIDVTSEWSHSSRSGHVCLRQGIPGFTISAPLSDLSDPNRCFHNKKTKGLLEGRREKCDIWGTWNHLSGSSISGECKGTELFNDGDDAAFDRRNLIDPDSEHPLVEECRKLSKTTLCNDW